MIECFKIYTVLFAFTCSSQELKLIDGIYSETPTNQVVSAHYFTLDNISYKLNSEFLFDYYYLDTNGGKFKFEKNQTFSKSNPLNLTSFESKTENTIDLVQMVIDDPIEMFSSYDSTYTQTVFSYNFLNSDSMKIDTMCDYIVSKNPVIKMNCGDEYSGIVDNEANLWMHPPRQFSFKILQLCPYPFQVLTDDVDEWSWKLTTGGFYLDERWIQTDSLIDIDFTYNRMENESLETLFGIIDCVVTKGKGNCDYGSNHFTTNLKSYYHPNYGFIRLEYQLINGDRLIFELVKAKL